VPYFYQIADVTVDPVFETDAAKGRCPLKMFESWIMETPFVTADVGDRKFLAGNPPSALLAKPGSSEDLALQLSRVLSNPRLAEELIFQGKQNIRNYLWHNLANDLCKILDNLLNKR